MLSPRHKKQISTSFSTHDHATSQDLASHSEESTVRPHKQAHRCLQLARNAMMSGEKNNAISLTQTASFTLCNLPTVGWLLICYATLFLFLHFVFCLCVSTCVLLAFWSLVWGKSDDFLYTCCLPWWWGDRWCWQHVLGCTVCEELCISGMELGTVVLQLQTVTITA